MISSIVLLLLQYFGVVNPDVSLGFWKWYILSLSIELALTILGIKQIDRHGMEKDKQ